MDQSDNEAAAATFHQAEATVMMKQAALTQAEANLAYTHIFAPVDGVVISRQVDVGQTVAVELPARRPLFQIANDLAQMQIDALVSEADIGGVETNQSGAIPKSMRSPLRTFLRESLPNPERSTNQPKRGHLRLCDRRGQFRP